MKALIALLVLISFNASANEEREEAARKCLYETAYYTNTFIGKALVANETLKADTRKSMLNRLYTEIGYGRQFRETVLEECLTEKNLMSHFLKFKNDPRLHKYELEDLGH